MNYRAAFFFGVVLTASSLLMAKSPASTPGSVTTAPPSAPASSEAAPATTASNTPTSANADPSPEMIKKARREGYKPQKQKNGETLFCASDTSATGTRFAEKKCVKPEQMDALIEARQDQRNELNRTRACAGCSSH